MDNSYYRYDGTIDNDSSSFTMEQMRLNVRSSIILEESCDHEHEC